MLSSAARWRAARAALLFILLLLVIGSRPQATQAKPNTQFSDAFAEVSCATMLPDAMLEPDQATCGYVTVPELHAEPDGNTIELAVVIFHSTGSSSAPDPLVMMQGGPGGSTIDTYTSLITLGDDFTILDDRDIVLFDQRGTLYSKPNLICKEDLELTQRTIEESLPYEEALRLSEEASAACRQRLIDEGVNLAAYNSIENAADIQDLRRALGYDEINLYGVSYGTLLGQHIMANYPEGIRSVILDAVAPTSINFIPAIAQSQERAFDAFFAACAADATCQADFPNLERTFEEVVARLNDKPTRIRMSDAEGKKSYNAIFSGNDFRDSVFQLLYATEFLPLLPTVIDEAGKGNLDPFGVVMPLIIFDRTMSTGMYMSVICAEDADYSMAEVDVEGVRDILADTADTDAQGMLDTCQMWDVPELGASVDAPVRSDIPTLLYSGQFDPITPPAFAERVAETLPNSTNVVFPNTGHGAFGSEDCAMTIARDFLDNPEGTPNTSCVNSLGGPEFLGDSDVMVSGFGGRLMNWLTGNDLWSFWLMLAALAVLLSLFVIWPLIWIVRAVTSRRGGPSNFLTHGVALAAAGVATLPVLLGIGIFAMLMLAYLNDPGQLNTLTVGIPSGWLLVMLIAPFVAVMVLLMVVGTLFLWAKKYWTLPERLYFTGLTLAGVVLVAMMALNHFFVNPLA